MPETYLNYCPSPCIGYLFDSTFIWLLTHTSDFIIRLLGIKASSDSRVTEEEIKAIIQEGTEGGST